MAFLDPVFGPCPPSREPAGVWPVYVTLRITHTPDPGGKTACSRCISRRVTQIVPEFTEEPASLSPERSATQDRVSGSLPRSRPLFPHAAHCPHCSAWCGPHSFDHPQGSVRWGTQRPLNPRTPNWNHKVRIRDGESLWAQAGSGSGCSRSEQRPRENCAGCCLNSVVPGIKN